MNMLYDLSKKIDPNINWDNIKDSLAAEPMVGNTHLDPVHKGGRGAGNHCLLKDMEAFKNIYKELMNDVNGADILDSLIDKNVKYLISSGKDKSILNGVYGKIK